MEGEAEDFEKVRSKRSEIRSSLYENTAYRMKGYQKSGIPIVL